MNAGAGAAGPDSDDFRRTVGHFPTGVTVVTTTIDGILHGMTANAFASVSLDPLLILVCVERTAGLHELLPRSQAFAVTVLGAEQTDASLWFASGRRPAGRDQFGGIAWHPAPVSGAPVLDGGVAYLDCTVAGILDGGDHSIFLGRVTALGILSAGEPLVFHNGGYRHLAPRPPDAP